MIRSIATMLALLCTASVNSETVDVRNSGAMDLASFACTDTPRSTLVRRVCYDEKRQHLLVNVRGIYLEYCRLPASTFEALIVAPSMGQVYRQRIASPAMQFACGAAN